CPAGDIRVGRTGGRPVGRLAWRYLLAGRSSGGGTRPPPDEPGYGRSADLSDHALRANTSEFHSGPELVEFSPTFTKLLSYDRSVGFWYSGSVNMSCQSCVSAWLARSACLVRSVSVVICLSRV